MISSFDHTENPELLYNEIRYKCGAVAVCLCYDNLEEPGRMFRALEIESLDGLASISSDIEGCCKEILTRMNVPYESCAIRVAESNTTFIPIEEDSADIRMVNTTRVIFHSLVGEMDLWGGNNAGFEFDDEGRLVRLQCGAFLDIQSSFNLDSNEALDIAHSQVQNLLDDADVDIVYREVIQSIRILPTAIPNEGNLSGRVFSVAYLYMADVENSLYGSNYWQFILVDSDTGVILMSLQSIPGISGTTPTPQGAEVSIPSVTMFLVTALAFGMILTAIVAGPMEMSYPVLSLLVAPLYLRIARSRVLDNFNRGRIYQFISGNPGTSYSEMRSALRIPNGCIAFHLGVLERTGVIAAVADGRIRRHHAVKAPPSVGKM